MEVDTLMQPVLQQLLLSQTSLLVSASTCPVFLGVSPFGLTCKVRLKKKTNKKKNLTIDTKVSMFLSLVRQLSPPQQLSLKLPFLLAQWASRFKKKNVFVFNFVFLFRLYILSVRQLVTTSVLQFKQVLGDLVL
jgi:hypothetical protein